MKRVAWVSVAIFMLFPLACAASGLYDGICAAIEHDEVGEWYMVWLLAGFTAGCAFTFVSAIMNARER